MWLLHVVAVQASADWQIALALWLVTALIGGGFAWLSGEWTRPAALLTDLLLAAAGGTALSAATHRLGQDPIALILGQRLFWLLTGALLLLCLAHDATRFVARAGGTPSWWPISSVGGFAFLFAWLTGWPSEPGLIEATYDGGLAIKLLPESLHYQVHVGPLIGARAVPLIDGVRVRVEAQSLLIDAEGASRAARLIRRSVQLEDVHPRGRARELERGIAVQLAHDYRDGQSAADSARS